MKDFYFEILDNAINSIKSSFDLPGSAQYSKVKISLLKAMKGEDFTEKFESVCALYKLAASFTWRTM